MYGQTGKFEDCFLAYLDILGFKDKVKEAKGNVGKRFASLIEALKTMSEFELKSEKNTRTGKVEIRCSLFSDNIALMIKANDHDLPHLFLIIRYLHDKLLEQNLCLRGAIVKEKMYWPEKGRNILVGPAIIKAYELESKVAIYPRIIVDNDLQKHVKTAKIPAFPVSERGDLANFIRRGEDGVYFFDVLNPAILRKKGEELKELSNDSFKIVWNPKAESSHAKVLNNVKETITKNINNHVPQVRQKYEWLKTYLHSFSQNQDSQEFS